LELEEGQKWGEGEREALARQVGAAEGEAKAAAGEVASLSGRLE
jgi:hypothetical protein